MKKFVLFALAAIGGVLVERKYKVSEKAQEKFTKFMTEGVTIGKFVVDNNDSLKEEGEEEEVLIPSCDDL